MADLNKIREKLRSQRGVGVTRNGSLVEADPHNKGDKPNVEGTTTLEPKRFFIG
jgi:hypothetical protein